MTTAIKASPFNRNHLLRDAAAQAIYECMADDPAIHLFGEGAWVKNYYDAPRIYKDFGGRIVTMPIAEDGSMNFACGAALMGTKPIVNVIAGDFLYRAMDGIVNTAAKLNFMGAEHTFVIQAEFLLGGPTTGQRNEALFTHIPGLQVVIPSTPHDAYGLMRTILRKPGVTLFLEDRMVQDDGPWANGDRDLAGDVSVGATSWRVKGQRGNVTILTYGVMRQVVERALAPFKFNGDYCDDDYLMLCDVIDLCSLYPLDWRFIVKMLERTGRVLIVEPDVVYGGIGAEIAATLHERRPHIKVKRLGAPKVTAPASQALHHRLLPTEEEILAAVRDFGN